MSETITVLLNQLVYLFTNLTLINVLDILLVAAFLFVIFQLLYQTRAMQVLRGTLIIAIFGLAFFLLIPLETFRLLVQGLLIAGVISLPILFQDELRRALTGLGQIGLRRNNGSAYTRFEDSILTAVEQLSTRRHGALIVLEGSTPLDDVIETGIPMNAQQLTPELLTTIFYPNTPLHDGAVVLRGERIMAAACILPVQKEQTESEHLGTRHRAALGLSFQVPDTLVIVISEETGSISISQAGRIFRGLSISELDDWLHRFQRQPESRPSLRWNWIRSGGPKIILSNILVAITLSLVAWVSVTFQTNPPQQVPFNGVTLTEIPPPSDVVRTSEIPDTITVVVQATEDRLEQLNLGNINAELDLSGLDAGTHQIPVEVQLVDERVQLISVTPSVVSVFLEDYVSRNLEVNVVILDEGSLPFGYELGTVTTSPETILIQGQESLVNQVVQASVTVQLNARRDDFQVVLPVSLLDQQGNIVQGLSPSPQQVAVNVSINQTFNTRSIAIQAVWDSASLDPDYQVTSVGLEPSSVLLTGQPSALEQVGEYIETAVIDLTNVKSEFSTEIPLILPDGVTALSEDGIRIFNVRVNMNIEPITDYLALTERIEIRNLNPDFTAQLGVTSASVLLFGPRTALEEIRSEQGLVLVYIDLEEFTQPGTYSVPLQYEAPESVETELFPAEIQVIINEQP